MTSTEPGSGSAAADRDPGWDYAPAPESTQVEIAPTQGCWIDGAETPFDPARALPSENPATGEELYRVVDGGAGEVADAVAAARAALPLWAGLAGLERGKILFRVARRLQERAREFAVMETLDGGKAIRESRDFDVPAAAQHFFYHAGWADKLEYAFPGRRVAPIGVCGQIVPWNFPLMMAAWKIAPALACGNTVVLKPAETTSLTALRLAALMSEAGVPPGVVNVVSGGPATGAALVRHPDLDKVAFTGSTEVGRQIARSLAGSGCALTLELGGKSAQIVCEDADLDQAVEGVVRGIYFNQGHVCSAGSRLLVQESVMEVVLDKLQRRMRQLRVGDPLDKNTDVGAIHSAAQLDRVQAAVRCAEVEGAQRVVPLPTDLPARGHWFTPCFFRGVQPNHSLARQEVFGPVLAVMSFRTVDEALARANDSSYGLAAGVWTDKGSKMFHLARELRVGVVWCNSYNRFDAASPFGGNKESGFGREGGRHGLP